MKRIFCLLIILIGVAIYVNGSNGFTNAGKTNLSQSGANKLSYTLDGTLEPDEIPDFVAGVPSQQLSDSVTLRVDAPVKLKSNNNNNNNRNSSNNSNNNSNSSSSNNSSGSSKNVESAKSKQVSDDVELATRISPPTLKFTDMILPEMNNPYALVQYSVEKSKPKIHNHNHKHKRVVSNESDFGYDVTANDETESYSTATNIKSGKTAALPDPLLMSIQTVLKSNSARSLSTVSNTPGDVLLAALPYGADAKIWQPDPNAVPVSKSSRNKNVQQGNHIYSIGTLCWNYACSGKTLLRADGKNVYAKVGSGYQLRPGSFLALLAMSNIMPNYELKVGGGIYTIGNLIASEKRSVTRGSNMSMILVGLSFYGTAADSWKNDLGESWNIERMVIEELNRSIDQGTSDVTDWLLGLTAAVNLYEEENIHLRGAVALAKKQIGVYQEWVLSVQNENYLWHPQFFLYRGVGADNYETLYSSGHILRWLVLSLSDERLQDVRVKRSINSLIAAINRVPNNLNAGTLSDRQLEALAISLQTISIYKQRVYGVEQQD
ncbi:MAG: hypothetical protein LBE18_12255 [Planctomycetaceae bacterium]|jgi:hypothetical protein|nr:hypothetical protein [Planctomycetaceae bacterium]